MPRAKRNVDSAATSVAHRLLFGGVLATFSFTLSKLLDALEGEHTEGNEQLDVILAELRRIHTSIGEELTRLENLIP
jgi:hypothetical protein